MKVPATAFHLHFSVYFTVKNSQKFATVPMKDESHIGTATTTTTTTTKMGKTGKTLVAVVGKNGFVFSWYHIE